MKKIIAATLTFVMLVTSLSGCNFLTSIVDRANYLTNSLRYGATLDNVAPLEAKAIVDSLIPVKTESYFGRSQLKPDEQRVYDSIVYCAENLIPRLNVSNYEFDKCTIDKIIIHYSDDFPQHFWMSKSYSYSFVGEKVLSISFSYGIYQQKRDKLNSDREAVENAVKEILEGITDIMSDYEKELIIHDRLLQRVEYDETLNQHNIQNIYGVFVNKLAVCEGYAKAFQYLMYCAGINSLYVKGVAKDVLHGWNMVLIDNNYYFVDPTWNDPTIEGISRDYIEHSYFNLMLEQISKDHQYVPDKHESGVQTSYILPETKSNEYNFYIVNNLVINEKSTSVISSKISKILAKAANDGQKYAEIKVDNGNTISTFIDKFLNVEILNIINQANKSIVKDKISLKNFSYTSNEDQNTICILLR